MYRITKHELNIKLEYINRLLKRSKVHYQNGRFEIESYTPDTTKLYKLIEIESGGAYHPTTNFYMDIKEFNRFLDGFISALELTR